MSYTDKAKTFPQQQIQAPYEPMQRVVRDLGYGIKTPQNAITGSYIDKKCPFTGDIKIHCCFVKGVVTKMKNEKTIVVKKNYLHYVKKYKRFQRRSTSFNAHISPAFFGMINVGDIVNMARTNRMSKTKNFVIVEVMKSANKEVKSFD